MRALSFVGELECSAVHDLWTADMSLIPQTSGAYVLLAGPGTKFLYPKGSSAVFYIGQAVNLRKRLTQHRKYSQQASSGKNRQLALYYPRYEYAAAFGCRFVFIRTSPRQTPKRLEEAVLGLFAKRFRSFPIANGAGSWNEVD